MDCIVNAKHLTLSREGGVNAAAVCESAETPTASVWFRDLNLQLYEQELAVLIGSAQFRRLLPLLCGLSLPQEGSIAIRCSSIGYLAARCHHLNWYSFYQNQKEPEHTSHKKNSHGDLSHGNHSPSDYLVNCDTCIGPSPLPDWNQSRAALLRSLLHTSDLLLLDEPFFQLDSDTRRRLYEELYELCKQENRSVLLITDETWEASVIADRILIPQKGQDQLAQLSISYPGSSRQFCELEHSPLQRAYFQQIWDKIHCPLCYTVTMIPPSLA